MKLFIKKLFSKKPVKEWKPNTNLALLQLSLSSKSVSMLFFSVVYLSALPAFADSAAAWKAYQDGKNPLLELSLLIVGIIIFFSLLVGLNKLSEKKKKQQRRRKNK